eukprot:1309643-Rhodomonas_salina.1
MGEEIGGNANSKLQARALELCKHMELVEERVQDRLPSRSRGTDPKKKYQHLWGASEQSPIRLRAATIAVSPEPTTKTEPSHSHGRIGRSPRRPRALPPISRGKPLIAQSCPEGLRSAIRRADERLGALILERQQAPSPQCLFPGEEDDECCMKDRDCDAINRSINLIDALQDEERRAGDADEQQHIQEEEKDEADEESRCEDSEEEPAGRRPWFWKRLLKNKKRGVTS